MGTVTLSEAPPVEGGMYVVASGVATLPLLTHCATEQGRILILLPVSVRVSAGPSTEVEV